MTWGLGEIGRNTLCNMGNLRGYSPEIAKCGGGGEIPHLLKGAHINGGRGDKFIMYIHVVPKPSVPFFQHVR